MSTENILAPESFAVPAPIAFVPPVLAGKEDPLEIEMRPCRVIFGSSLTIVLEVKGHSAIAAGTVDGAVSASAQAKGKVGFQDAASFLAWLDKQVDAGGDERILLDLTVRGDADSVRDVQSVLQEITAQAFH